MVTFYQPELMVKEAIKELILLIPTETTRPPNDIGHVVVFNGQNPSWTIVVIKFRAAIGGSDLQELWRHY